MRTLRFLLKKEFRQIFRDRAIVMLIFFMPAIQLIIMPLAADYEVRNINLAVVDHDKSPYSQKLVSTVIASGYFRLRGYNGSFKEAFKLIETDEADLILEIPRGFEKNLIREDRQKLFLAVNAINGTKANLGGSYLGTIIGNFNAEIRMQLVQPPRYSQFPVIDIVASNWFNPVLNYKIFIVPGILAILVTMVGGFLSALNIVREKEIGTIEQINVTPIKKHIFILGKLIPFWVLANIIFTIGLLLAWLVYGIKPVGSLFVLYVFIAVYLLTVLGFGLLVSTFCETQQQAMFIMFFFMMIFILLGGLFTSIDSMPDWAQMLTRFNPVRYMIEVMRMIILKGSTFADVLPHLAAVAFMAVVLNSCAVINYKKTN